MVASSTYTAPISESTSLRYKPEVGARWFRSARRDLCVGCRVTGIPTATDNIELLFLRRIILEIAEAGTLN